MNSRIALAAILLATCSIAFADATRPAAAAPSIRLTNDAAHIAITPHGGTILEYALTDLPNVLDSSPDLLTSAADQLVPTANTPAFPLNGHTTWVAPQHEWWRDQSLSKNRGNWPPDAWLTVAAYTVVDQSPTHVALESPDSPIWGVRMKKSITLHPDGSATVKATITNIRNTPVEWAVWSNTRVNPDALVVVPVEPKTNLRLEFETNASATTMPWAYEFADGNWLADFRRPEKPSPPDAPAPPQSGKAFINTPITAAAAILPGAIFLKRAVPPTKLGTTAPRHATVEIYHHSGPDSPSLVELELHGPIQTLAPGESTTLTEFWQILPTKDVAEKDRIHRANQSLRDLSESP